MLVQARCVLCELQMRLLILAFAFQSGEFCGFSLLWLTCGLLPTGDTCTE